MEATQQPDHNQRHQKSYAAERQLVDNWIRNNPRKRRHAQFVADNPNATHIRPGYIKERRRAMKVSAALLRGDDPATVPPTNQMERHIVLSDLHYREYNERVYDPATNAHLIRKVAVHDSRALAAAELFMRSWQPTHIHLNGDLIDFPQFSRFDKEDYENEGLEQDILGLRVILKRIRRNHPDAQIDYELGNHEERLERYMRQNAPALRWLTSLTFHAIFEAKELGITIYPYRERVPILPGVLEITHGDKIAQKSGYTGQRMLEAGVSGVSGHVHRLGMVFRTTRTGMTVWAEGGCLCSLEPSYVNSPNWQQGIVAFYVDRPNARFHMDVVPIISGRIVYAGQVYEAA